jgi:hypothetical protein
MRPDDAFARIEAATLLNRAITEILSQRERRVIEGRFFDGLTFDQLRPLCNNVSQSRIRQILSHALLKRGRSGFRRDLYAALEDLGGHALPDWMKPAYKRREAAERLERLRAQAKEEQPRVIAQQVERALMNAERHELGDDPAYETFKAFIDKWSGRGGIERETCAFLNASDVQLERRRRMLLQERRLELAAQFTRENRDATRKRWLDLPPFHAPSGQ